MCKFLIIFSFVFMVLPSAIYSQSCITINQHPENYLTLDNDDIVLSVSATSIEDLTYQWQVLNSATDLWDNIVDNIDYSGTNTPILTITNINQTINNTIFRVLVSTSNNACIPNISDEALITYVIIKINTLFTPNDDGFNDFFTIRGLNYFPNNKLQIYNRWGNLIYEKKDYQNDWNGVSTNGFSIKGTKKVPSGTYFYTLDLDFDNKKLSGWLYINR